MKMSPLMWVFAVLWALPFVVGSFKFVVTKIFMHAAMHDESKLEAPSLIWVIVESTLAIPLAFSLFLVPTTIFESTALAVLILICAQVRRSQAQSGEVFFQGVKQHIQVLKVAETAFSELSKQDIRIAKAIKKRQSTINDLPEYPKSLGLVRCLEVDSATAKFYRKVELAALLENISPAILCLLAYYKIKEGIVRSM
jgi:hypothetical protein